MMEAQTTPGGFLSKHPVLPIQHKAEEHMISFQAVGGVKFMQPLGAKGDILPAYFWGHNT